MILAISWLKDGFSVFLVIFACYWAGFEANWNKPHRFGPQQEDRLEQDGPALSVLLCKSDERSAVTSTR